MTKSTNITTRPLGAQISHMLKDRGVDVIFGIPGVHNQEMYRGIEEAGIKHVLARHEQGAGFMADGYARASGKPGVAYVITGPGVCNIMTPMGQAYSDSVPVLVISSCLDEIAAQKGQLHQMNDQRAAAATVCDWSEEARSAEAAYQLIDRAFSEFAGERPRSKHLQVPIALLEGQADAASRNATPRKRVSADDVQIRNVIDQLQNAQRPLIILGGGAAKGEDDGVATAMRTIGAASMVSTAGRGLVSPADPMAFGPCLGRPSSVDVLKTADLVIVVGCELAQVDLWREELGHEAPLIRVDLDLLVLGQEPLTSDAIQSDGASFIKAIAGRLIDPLQTEWDVQEIANTRANWRAEIAAERPNILPITEALRDCLPQDTMIYSDMTQIAYVAVETWDMEVAGHWHHPSGFGTLGYATPAAIGGAIARPNQPTLAIIGDYGFHYTCQELGVAVELGLSLPIILWDNGKLKEIEDSMTAAQIAPNAVIAQNPDYCKLAEAFGAYSVAPSSLAQMQEAVQTALKADGPTLIYVTPDILS
ncbi:MAG: thiamine pyrophosphate-binding protein [Lentilitoribacter sp.]